MHFELCDVCVLGRSQWRKLRATHASGLSRAGALAGTFTFPIPWAWKQAWVPCWGFVKQPTCHTGVWAPLWNLFTGCHQEAFAEIRRIDSVLSCSPSVQIWPCRMTVHRGRYSVHLPNSGCAWFKLEILFLKWIRHSISLMAPSYISVPE